jgi:hypothetical protein
MSVARPSRIVLALAAAGLLAGLAPVLGQQLEFGFMPKGGKTLLIEALGHEPKSSELRAIVEARHTEAEWREAMASRTKGLSERELKTLAAYLAINMPVPDADGAAAKASRPDELVAALPRVPADLRF